MAIIIDGYNLMFVWTGKELRNAPVECQRARERLIRFIAQYKAAHSDRIAVVFDGAQEGTHWPRFQRAHDLDIYYSEPTSDADAEIMRMVADSPNPGNIRVVTSDGAIASYVRRHGAQVIGSRDFMKEVKRFTRDDSGSPEGEPVEKYEGLHEDEVDFWLHQFGGKPEEQE